MAGWEKSTRRQRLPAGWHKIRAAVLERDGHRCTWFEHGQRCPERGTEVDHIRAGDDHDPANLRSLCPAHHQAKSSSEGGRAAAARRAKRRREPEAHPGLRKK